MNADLELDCRRMRCPLPVIAAWCRMRGQEYVGEDTAPGGVPRFVVRRTS